MLPITIKTPTTSLTLANSEQRFKSPRINAGLVLPSIQQQLYFTRNITAYLFFQRLRRPTSFEWLDKWVFSLYTKFRFSDATNSKLQWSHTPSTIRLEYYVFVWCQPLQSQTLGLIKSPFGVQGKSLKGHYFIVKSWTLSKFFDLRNSIASYIHLPWCICVQFTKLRQM